MSQRHVHSISLNKEQELELDAIREHDEDLSIVDIFMFGVKYIKDGIDNNK